MDLCQFLLIDHFCYFRWRDDVYHFMLWDVICYIMFWDDLHMSCYDMINFFYILNWFFMPIYVTRWFILSLIGQNGIPGFDLLLK